jgi:hypothetical protein
MTAMPAMAMAMAMIMPARTRSGRRSGKTGSGERGDGHEGEQAHPVFSLSAGGVPYP